jgi:hypothetical protein
MTKTNIFPVPCAHVLDMPKSQRVSPWYLCEINSSLVWGDDRDLRLWKPHVRYFRSASIVKHSHERRCSPVLEKRRTPYKSRIKRTVRTVEVKLLLLYHLELSTHKRFNICLTEIISTAGLAHSTHPGVLEPLS